MRRAGPTLYATGRGCGPGKVIRISAATAQRHRRSPSAYQEALYRQLDIRFWRDGEETAFEVTKGDPKLVERCDVASKVAPLRTTSDPF